MDRSTKEKINKETQTLNDTMGQLDLIMSIGYFSPKQSISPILKCSRNLLQNRSHLGP